MHKLIILLLLISSFTGLTQQYQFKYYDKDHGIEEPYIYDIVQCDDGILWLATSGGIKKFDGENFENINSENGLKDNFIKSAAKLDNVILAGHNSGVITLFKNGLIFKTLETENTSPINDIIVFENKFYALSQAGRVLRIDTDGNYKILDLVSDKIYKTLLFFKRKLYVGSNEGIDKYSLSDDSLTKESSLNGFQDFQIETIHVVNKTLYIGTSANGLYQYSNGTAEKIHFDYTQDNLQIKDIIEHYGSIYLATFGNGVYRLKSNPVGGPELDLILNSSTNLKSAYINKIFFDRENALWIGSYGDGLINMTNQAFIRFNISKELTNSEITSFFVSNQKYIGTKGKLWVLQKENMHDNNQFTSYDQANGIPNDQITSIHVSIDTTIVIGTKTNGSYFKKKKDRVFKKISLENNLMSNLINQITKIAGKYYISTGNGLFILNNSFKNVNHYSTLNGLPHNNINGVANTARGIAILTSCSTLPILKLGKLQYIKIPSEIGIADFSGAVSFENNIYFSTLGKGIIIYNEDKSFEVLSKAEGLKSNYCYKIEKDVLNKIWVTHRAGISNFSPLTKQLSTFAQNSFINVDFEPIDISSDTQNNLWFASTMGAIKYMPYLDNVHNIKPLVSLVDINVDNEVFESNKISKSYGKRKVKFNFKAVSTRYPEEVYYQFKLDGFDEDWSEESTQNFAQFNRLYDGEYKLYVRSKILTSGIWTEPHLLATININEPVWKQWWFYLGILLLIIASTFFIVRYRTNKFKERNEKLEFILNKRTEEIVAQRNELAIQNKDIQDSIAYAERIQNSLLPQKAELKSMFQESFILLKPKDVVSGDFYWFDQFDNITILACADATGHGVPGAFMSIIGSTLIKEFANSSDINSPECFLEELDFQINDILGQYGKEGDGRDGMDISVVEIDTNTNMMRTSSALRPIYVIREHEIYEIKASRLPVGGGTIGIQKSYDLEEFQLQKDDIIYQFSDGYADQFGGEKGKKLRIKPFKRLLLQIHHLPLAEQKDKLNEFFAEWKGGLDQIDDVLIMAVKI